VGQTVKTTDAEVLDTTFDLIWRRGCDAVSIRDLEPGDSGTSSAHTYGRTDADPAARFHTQWSGDRTDFPIDSIEQRAASSTVPPTLQRLVHARVTAVRLG
jgi:hypothetical protein